MCTQEVSSDKVRKGFCVFLPPAGRTEQLLFKKEMVESSPVTVELKALPSPHDEVSQPAANRSETYHIEGLDLLTFCVISFRKLFPLETETKTRGSTSRSSPSTWRSTRRSCSWPSRAWTKTTMVRSHSLIKETSWLLDLRFTFVLVHRSNRLHRNQAVTCWSGAGNQQGGRTENPSEVF